jgi:hypothetical protein
MPAPLFQRVDWFSLKSSWPGAMDGRKESCVVVAWPENGCRSGLGGRVRTGLKF